MHSIWLELESLHYHAGGVVQARVLFGNMMQREGGAEIRGLGSYVLDPSGNRLEADIAPGEDNYHRVAFFAGSEGLYALVLENEAGIYLAPGDDHPAGSSTAATDVLGDRYFQRARIAVPVGHHIEGRLQGLESPGLDIFIAEFREYRPGDKATIRVLYNGRPLSGAEVAATYHLYTGPVYPWRGKTGEDGSVGFTFTEKGHWMFTCAYTGKDSGKPGGYGKTHYTGTFVVPGVR